MNRSDLVKMTSNATGFKVTDVDRILSAFLDCVALSLSAGETVKLKRFGNFELRVRQPTVRKNPQTGMPMQIGETKSVAFIPGDILRNRLNERPTGGPE